MHGLRNIRSAITREMLLFKAEISYTIQLNIENNWLWQPSIINIFKVSFVIRAYHIYAINSEIFCSQRRRKKMSACSGTMSWTKFYIISQSLQVIIQEKSHWPPWPLWQRPWIILEQDLRPYQHYYKLVVVCSSTSLQLPKFLNYKLLKNFLWTCQPMFFKSF